MRVGVVCPYDMTAPGGVQQLTLELTRELRRAGDEAVLVGAGSPERRDPGRDPGAVVVGRSLRFRANNSVVPLTMSPWSWSRIRRALSDVEVIHVHEPLVPLVGWVALTVDRPLVATFHADPPGWVPELYRRTPMLGQRMRRAVITAVSPTAAAALPASWGQVRVVPNAIDVAAYRLPVGRVGHRVAFLGRDEPRKGLDLLLEVWPEIKKRVPQAELKVMGTNRDDSIPGVEFMGRVSGGAKNRMLASSLVYVAPNTGGESFGIVVAEAMAAGCAVVCSDLEAFRDVAGGTARTVPVGDGAAMADAVASLLTSPEVAEEMGGRARQAVTRFDWDAVVGQYQQAYRDAVA